MKYMKLTFEYLFKNIWYVLLLCIVPGVLLGLLTDPTSMFHYIVNIGNLSNPTYGDIFLSATELNWISFGIGIIVIPIVAMFISALCGIESKHMRLGVKNYRNFFKRVNNNIMYVGLVGLMLIIALELMGIIFTSFAFLWAKVISSTAIAIALNLIIAGVLMILMLFLFSWCIIWLPTMTITGLNPKRALVQTMVNVRGKKLFKLFISVVLPLIPIFGISCTLTYFDIKFRKIFYIVAYTFMFMYYVTLMYTSYCEICDIDREDKKPSFVIDDKTDIQKEK